MAYIRLITININSLMRKILKLWIVSKIFCTYIPSNFPIVIFFISRVILKVFWGRRWVETMRCTKSRNVGILAAMFLRNLIIRNASPLVFCKCVPTGRYLITSVNQAVILYNNNPFDYVACYEINYAFFSHNFYFWLFFALSLRKNDLTNKCVAILHM